MVQRGIFITLAIVGVFVLYAFEVAHLNRTVGSRTLILGAVIIGAIGGLALGWRLRTKTTDGLERIQIMVACTLLTALLMPLVAGLSNRLLVFRPAQEVPVEFIETDPRVGIRFGNTGGVQEPTSYIHFFYKGDQLVRLQTRYPIFPETAQRGDTLFLPLVKGRWGFEFVPQFAVRQS